MIQSIVHIALVVDDYDKAIDFYINRLHFTLIEDNYVQFNENHPMFKRVK